jgi:hypothetical protein
VKSLELKPAKFAGNDDCRQERRTHTGGDALLDGLDT